MEISRCMHAIALYGQWQRTSFMALHACMLGAGRWVSGVAARNRCPGAVPPSDSPLPPAPSLPPVHATLITRAHSRPPRARPQHSFHATRRHTRADTAASYFRAAVLWSNRERVLPRGLGRRCGLIL
ncbi:unnamed protein product, partial [Iphiclides podalirius]